MVQVPSFDRESQRIDLSGLRPSFRIDQDKYLDWCRGADPFDKDARIRSLAGSTLQLRRNQIHSAVTALVDSGIDPQAIKGLACLVEPEAFKRIMRRRIEMPGSERNAFNHGLARRAAADRARLGEARCSRALGAQAASLQSSCPAARAHQEEQGFSTPVR